MNEKELWLQRAELLLEHYNEYLSARLNYQARKNSSNDKAKVNAVRNLKHDLRWDGFDTYVREYATSPFAFDECIDDTDWTMERVISDILGDYDKLKNPTL